jgi:CBS-domain-containing membrane protein
VQRCKYLVVCHLLLCLQEDTSLSKVHTLFRQLGLRHLAVIPRASCVMGVITRHDLLPEALEETFMGQQAPLGAGEQTIMQFCLSGWLLVARLVPPPWVP